jgi:hypothetical protein
MRIARIAHPMRALSRLLAFSCRPCPVSARILWMLCLHTLLFTHLLSAEEKMDGASFVDFAGYRGCVKLENDMTVVILGPHAGGRILSYTLHEKEALFRNTAQDGWVSSADASPVNVSAGRFDIGPEHTIPKHPNLWRGPWQIEITGPRQARMTSVADDATGVQLVRDFVLGKDDTQLSVTQTIHNISDETQHWCHWGRTLAQGHGICLIPLTPHSRFPKNYVMYGPGSVINFRPDDPNLRTRDGFLEIIGPPEHAKLGMDSHAGWFAYLMRNDVLFVKRYKTYPDRAYSEMAALTISIWYKDEEVCELEPIGPKENIAPGQSASFTEDWWLLPCDFPPEGQAVDLQALEKLVADRAR